MEEKAETWTCPHCLKTYSKNYRYKNHITKCVSHNLKLVQQAEVSQMVIAELKQELRDLLTELKETVKKSIEEVSVQLNHHPPHRQLNSQRPPELFLKCFK